LTSNNLYDEAELIQQLQLHNRNAFEQLYKQYSESMLGVINALVNDLSNAENLLQDSFIKIWKNIFRFDPAKGRLFTWIITICRNTAFNFLRKRGNYPKLEIRNDLENVYTGSLSSEPEQVNYIGMGKIVEKLDSNYRIIINMIYFYGYTQQETAQKLDLPLGTVKTRTRNALKILKAQLKD
jgi:RNA polymerase sigma-70 factor (ECF subfamily)